MANNLLKIRAELGLTQQEMSDRLKVSRTALFNAEHGKCSVGLAEKVAKTFNMNLFNVLGEDVFAIKPRDEIDVFYIDATIKRMGL